MSLNDDLADPIGVNGDEWLVLVVAGANVISLIFIYYGCFFVGLNEVTFCRLFSCHSASKTESIPKSNLNNIR